MKILHVITSLRTGGAEKLMVDLLPRLRSAGHEVELCVLDGIDTPFKSELLAKRIRIIELGRSANVYHPKYLWRLYRLLRHGDYDVVHTHNTAPQLFAAISSLLCSVVLCTTEHTTSNRRRGWRWYAPIDRWMYSRYRHIVCISDKTKENLINCIGDGQLKKITTVYNGIDITRYAKARPSEEIPSNRGKFNIIQVAGFRYQKDQPTLIRALQLLPENFHVYFAGDGVLRSNCEAIVEELKLGDRVHFMGIRTDVPELIAASDVCVVSSHWEGFGLAAVEAMAAIKPVIATDIPGLREVVNGAGILFPHEASETLAHEILMLEESPEHYRAVAAACRRRADDFDISTMVKGYNEMYLSLQ